MNGQYIITPEGSFIPEDELYHHGIKGMKWGIRRYQNDDGSLTAAGRKRYSNPDGTLNDKGKKYYAEQEARLKKERKAIMAQKRLDAKLGKLDAQRKVNEELRKSNPNKPSTGNDSPNKTVQKKENPSEMSDADLQNRVNRLRNEDAYRDLSKKLGYDGPKTEMDYKIEELKKQKEYLELQRDIKNLTPKKVSVGKKLMDTLVDKVIVPTAAEYGKKYVAQLISDQAAAAAKKLADDVSKEKAKQDAKQAKKEAKQESKQAKQEAKQAKQDNASSGTKRAKKDDRTNTNSSFESDAKTGTVYGEGTSSKRSSTQNNKSSSSGTVFDSDNVYKGSDGVYRYNDTPVTSMATTRNTSSGSNYVSRYSSTPIAGLLPAPKDDDD